MRPKVIAQTEISVDGAIGGFTLHMGTYYRVAAKLGADADLFGSETMLAAEMPDVPEGPEKFRKPVPEHGDGRHLWFVPDSRGRVRNLHAYRDSEWCLDVVSLISESTPVEYRRYLEERDYDYVLAGKERVDLRSALEAIADRYAVKTLRVDSGGALVSALLKEGLVDELSLLVSPVLAGCVQKQMFRTLSISAPIDLVLLTADVVGGGQLHLRYRVEKSR